MNGNALVFHYNCFAECVTLWMDFCRATLSSKGLFHKVAHMSCIYLSIIHNMAGT